MLFQPDANIGDVSQTINASGSTSGIKRSRVHLSRFVANSRDKKYFYLVLLVDHLIVLNRINNNMKVTIYFLFYAVCYLISYFAVSPKF